jgi:phosphate-selective porin OprO/OprP
VFNDWLDKDQPNSISDNGTQLVGRATWVALESSDQSTLLHLGGGLRLSNAREGGVGRSEPEFNNAPNFVETPYLDPDDFDTYQAEASLRSGPFWLHGEYIRNASDGTRFGDLQFGGYHVMASWVLSGEMRPYNRRVGIFGKVPIARTVDHNGWGAWELATRFSHVDLSDRAVDGGEMDIWSAGVNWWPSPYMNINLNYRYIDLDRFGIEGNSQGFNTRLVLMLE